MSDKPAPVVSEMNRTYFEGCACGELRIRRCHACGARFRFAHEWCPCCWSTELVWDKASGRGKVSQFSIVHQAPSKGFEADTPYVLALIELEEGVRMMSNVVDCDPCQVRIGLEVDVCFEARGDVALAMFRPARRPGADGRRRAAPA